MTRIFELTGRAGLEQFSRYVDCVVPDPDAFFVRTNRLELDAATVNRIHLSPAVQTPARARFQDMVSVVVMLGGNAVIDTPSGSVAVTPGQAFFDTGWGSRTSRSDDAIDALAVMVPASLAAERGIRLDPSRVTLGPAKPGMTTRALAHLATPMVARAKPRLAGATPKYVEAALLELMLGVYVEGRGMRAIGNEFDGSVHAQASMLIDKHFRDHRLTAAGVAERLSISLRTLHRAFEGTDTSVATEIRRLRCDYAETLLNDQDLVSRTVLDIAWSSGFPSATDLRRAIKARHGVTVRDFRATLRTALAAQ